ncbi:MAG TPA: 3-dehydroquinate synthase [Urbifossiella sp.]|jgi:3-dehydroquinate synthase|nr:3-dehydroquinate synthase [Urbifossiella sp.]
MESVDVRLGPRSYEIALTSAGNAGVGPFARRVLPASYSALVVTDAHTAGLGRAVEASLRDAGFRVALASVPAGEGSKSLAELARLYDALYEMAADRRTAVVAVGGGVVGDLGGFAAATYNRGLPLLMVPTTLLAMVDSSVGGKTGVNHPRGKNLIGAFHQPAGVWIDTTFLDTLPDREFRSGLAEVVKYGVILDAPFFAYLETHAAAVLARDPEAMLHVVGRSCRLKADVVEQDEREETGLRAVLNYGHTFAHAFETVGGYGGWLHGEAVAAGMVCAARLAERHGLVGPDLGERQLALLTAFGLPTAAKSEWPADDLIAVMRRDKKAAGGRMRFILPTRLGEVKLFDDVPDPLVRSVLAGP